MAFATAGAGTDITDDMHKGLIDRFRSLPMARSAVLTVCCCGLIWLFPVTFIFRTLAVRKYRSATA